MKCSEVTSFLSQIGGRVEPITPIPATDLDYLFANECILKTTKEDYESGSADVARLSQLTAQVETEKSAEEQSSQELVQNERKEHSFTFLFEDREKKDQLHENIQNEMAEISREESELSAMEANVNELIQKKSMMDRMVPFNGEYVSLTGVGSVALHDLDVRNYRVSDEEFPDFLKEIKATYAELRSIAERATSYIMLGKTIVPQIEEGGYSIPPTSAVGNLVAQAPSLLWSTAIGLAKLQGDPGQIAQRFVSALSILQNFDSTIPNKLMAAEIMTAASNQDLLSLQSILKNLDEQLRNERVPKELSVGIAATIMAGRRYDGTYPIDKFIQFKDLTSSSEAVAILSVMNIPFPDLSSKFQSFRSLFKSWGYMASEDTEIASAFLAIGELNASEVAEKLKYVVEQLRNYLEYPLVAAAILASIPVFESHEVLDLMEKAVTLLSGYAVGLEKSELVALSVRMIHGVRNELIKEVDSTAKIAETPVQFTYAPRPGFFSWYYPVIIAHSSYNATFSGMGGFHPAHSHGVGGFAG